MKQKIKDRLRSLSENEGVLIIFGAILFATGLILVMMIIDFISWIIRGKTIFKTDDLSGGGEF